MCRSLQGKLKASTCFIIVLSTKREKLPLMHQGKRVVSIHHAANTDAIFVSWDLKLSKLQQEPCFGGLFFCLCAPWKWVKSCQKLLLYSSWDLPWSLVYICCLWLCVCWRKYSFKHSDNHMCSDLPTAALHALAPGEPPSPRLAKALHLVSFWKRWKSLQLMVLCFLSRRAPMLWLRNHTALCIIGRVCSASQQDDTNWTLSFQVWHLRRPRGGLSRGMWANPWLKHTAIKKHTAAEFNPCHFHYLESLGPAHRAHLTRWCKCPRASATELSSCH